MKTMMSCALALLLIGARPAWPPAPILRVERSTVTFVSDAPLERIEAGTTHASGLLDIGARTFAVKIPVTTFDGFNSPLQREHFNENYMESTDHPNAVFQGRIIEAVDLAAAGAYKVRAKGMLTVHGVERERIVPCEVVVTSEGVRVTSQFDVLPADHDIRVPGIVKQKIAPAIKVKVDLLFRPAPAR